MSDDTTPITTEREFDTALTELLRRAADGGLSVNGGWDCRNNGTYPDWDIVVTEVKKSEPTD